jgi:hypothetical protein
MKVKGLFSIERNLQGNADNKLILIREKEKKRKREKEKKRKREKEKKRKREKEKKRKREKDKKR